MQEITLVIVYHNITEKFSDKKFERKDFMDQLQKIPEGEYTQRIYRENAYIILSLVCALSDNLNLSEKSKTACQKLIRELYDEIGTENIIITIE